MTRVAEQGCCGGAPTTRREEDAATVRTEQKDGCGCKNAARGPQAIEDASSEAGTFRTGERGGRCC